ncbi:HAD family hydrolase [Planosporangium thailandense]|uniref:HAD family hydrolase n=1 Tax=Planosporangium thailandense TaxID=765197 RepID=UPI003B830E97
MSHRPATPKGNHDPVPDRAPAAAPASVAAREPAQPPQAVLFDFQGTLTQVEDAVTWVREAAHSCGTELDRSRATVIADRLVTAGRAGGPVPCRVPPQLAEVYADRDLYPEAHRAAYTGLAQTVDCGVDGLAEALYARLLSPTGWVPYTDTVPTLKALRAAGVPVAIVSNIGFDIRPITAQHGFADLIDAFVLSYEVGRCKPDPAIFQQACGLLGVDPERVLMVGDSPADAGAVAAGCRALIVPAAPPGGTNGIGAVLDLAGL